MTDQNIPERAQEPTRAPVRPDDLLFPPYRIIDPQDRPQRTVPRWLEREQGKDLTGQVTE